MDLQKMLDNAVNAGRQERLKTSSQLILGELIAKLEALEDRTQTVSFAFENAVPTHLSSWRGSYNELALNFSFEENAPTVEDLIKRLKQAVGATYQGYKGGEFLMGKTTPVWVANYGNSGNTGITDVIQTEDDEVILKTEYCRF